MIKATVKSWSDSKGFGFVSCEGLESVFAHYTAIYGDGFKTLEIGETVEIELVTGPKGSQCGKIIRIQKVGA